MAEKTAWQFLFVFGATAGYSQYSRHVLPLQSSWLVKLAMGIAVAVIWKRDLNIGQTYKWQTNFPSQRVSSNTTARTIRAVQGYADDSEPIGQARHDR